MLSREWLSRLQLDIQDIAKILEKDAVFGKKIAPLAKAYMDCKMVLKPYTQEELVAAKNEALTYLEKAQQAGQTEEDQYMLPLLFWLHCIPFLEQTYCRLGIRDEVLLNSMMDLTYKVRECKKNYGYCGVSTPRFYQFFRCELFGLGRLQYQNLIYEEEAYTAAGYTLCPGDRVYGCHIPSSGRLTPQLCMDSLDQAYNFFKEELKDDVLPVCCSSWLLYPPYAEKVFADGSNLKAFSQMFDVVSTKSSPTVFGAAPFVFYTTYSGDPDRLPQETSLQRNFVSYIKAGGDFGNGRGILLYDGVKKTIINSNR